MLLLKTFACRNMFAEARSALLQDSGVGAQSATVRLYTLEERRGVGEWIVVGGNGGKGLVC